jgi:hypothetical protein
MSRAAAVRGLRPEVTCINLRAVVGQRQAARPPDSSATCFPSDFTCWLTALGHAISCSGAVKLRLRAAASRRETMREGGSALGHGQSHPLKH